MNTSNRRKGFLPALLCLHSVWIWGAEPATLEIGAPAPGFDLPGVDGQNHRLADFAESPFLVVIFTCNHCPTAQSYEDRIVQLVNDYAPRGVALVAISPNDPLAIRLDELGYTDLSDTLEEMKIRADYKSFNLPYLYDGENQEVSRAYGPVATPHTFVFDSNRRLRYVGRIDDSEDGVHVGTKHDLRNALDALLAGQPVPVEKTKTFGCSVKWSEYRSSVEEFNRRLSGESVTLSTIDADGVRNLVRNNSENLRLINVWATWCGPCVVEFPAFVEIYRMYRHRGLEFASISADNPDRRERVLKFLEQRIASNPNYLFDSGDQYELIEAVDENWQGALPYTMLVKPGGEVVYAQQGELNPLEMKRRIVAVLGREKDW